MHPILTTFDDYLRAFARPLSGLLGANRGQGRTLHPKGKVTVVDAKSKWLQGEAIGIVLDIELSREGNKSTDDLVEDGFLPYVRAHLVWGTGEVSFEADCDWLLGTQIVLPAQSVRVDAVYKEAWLAEPPITLEDPECPCAPTFRVGATLNYGARAHNSNSARLTEPVYVPAGETKRIQIPQYALSFTVLPVGSGAQVIPISVFGFGSGARVYYSVTGPLTNVAQHDMESAFPIFNGARYLEIDNSDGQSPVSTLVVFGLAF